MYIYKKLYYINYHKSNKTYVPFSKEKQSFLVVSV